jgi:hypothetical protein
MDAYYDDPYDDRHDRYHLKCLNADCRSITRSYQDKAKAIKRWNDAFGVPKPEKPVK